MMVPAYHCPATHRHSEILGFCTSSIINYLGKNDNYFLFRGKTDLVYWNMDECFFEMINLDNLEITPQIFLDDVINTLDFVMPDIMLFHNNECLGAKDHIKVAGFPDLIVEVWQDGNFNDCRNFKRKLYATSPTTEFWQITQNSNIVKCSIGNKKIMDKSLTEPM
ncbi:MAG: hypothetical protein FWG64_01930, partial [Firmicutes bacterium]|nr:hypothetical protein [Bacillota bacterium]